MLKRNIERLQRVGGCRIMTSFQTQDQANQAPNRNLFAKMSAPNLWKCTFANQLVNQPFLGILSVRLSNQWGSVYKALNPESLKSLGEHKSLENPEISWNVSSYGCAVQICLLSVLPCQGLCCRFCCQDLKNIPSCSLRSLVWGCTTNPRDAIHTLVALIRSLKVLGRNNWGRQHFFQTTCKKRTWFPLVCRSK